MPIRWIIIVLMISCMLPDFSPADMCSWVDKNGVRHFSNTNNCNGGESSVSPEVEGSDEKADQNRLGLRFMGMYCNGIHYLRFYGDGTVVSASSTGRPEQLASWFGKSAKFAYKGRYWTDGKKVRFYTLYEKNVVLAEGIVQNDVLGVVFLHVVEKHLNERNHVQQGIRYYKFTPVDFPRPNRY